MMEQITVQYFNSACVGIRTPDFSILCDPWFTDGAFDGAWYTFPKIENPLGRIGQFDYIWISHLHQDHYDRTFLRQYLDKYPSAQIIVGIWDRPFLYNILTRDGFTPMHLQSMSKHDTCIAIIPCYTDPLDVDSALVVKWKDQSVVNLNDCLESKEQLEAIKGFAPHINIALMGFTGAGPYPQAFYEKDQITKEMLDKRAETTLGRYLKVAKFLDADVNMPFAGQYLLGGRLADLNDYRGTMDAIEVRSQDPKAIVLDSFGTIGTKSGPDKDYLRVFTLNTDRRIEEIKNEPMHWERDIKIDTRDIRWERLFHAASNNCRAKSQYKNSYYFCFPNPVGNGWYFLDVNSMIGTTGANRLYGKLDSVSHLFPRSEITVDYRYLFGLLTGVYHWDNANGASQLKVRRHPDEDNKPARQCLAFFHI